MWRSPWTEPSLRREIRSFVGEFATKSLGLRQEEYEEFSNLEL